MAVSYLFVDNTFNDALRDIESLGFRVSDKFVRGSTPYMVISGRSNRRWWLLPLNNRRVTISGMALFQPVITSAKLFKGSAVAACLLGLANFSPGKKIYISGKSYLADIFNDDDLHYAFFTGTDSPHRKVAVQVMDRAGVIKGFAKVSRNPEVRPLLTHEAEYLDYLSTLDLQTAHIPAVLSREVLDDASILVTDTLKTVKAKTVTNLKEAHFTFLDELANKTVVLSSKNSNQLLTELGHRYHNVVERLPSKWQYRIEQGIENLNKSGEALGPAVLSHGDFTPWNTFFTDDQLYVFDWEYADHIYPAGYDLIHFFLSLPDTWRQPAAATVEQVLSKLREMQSEKSDKTDETIFLTYLCGHTLHYIGRGAQASDKITTWDGAEKVGAMFDALIARKS